MAERIEDRVKQMSMSTGMGDFTLAGDVLGYKTFASVLSIGDTFHGAIVAVDGSGSPTGDWETGYYTYKAANTIERTIVRSSSATSNAKVPFAAGLKYVFIDLTAYQIRNFSTATTGGTAVKPNVPSELLSAYGELLFQDEFSSTVIDTTKWTTDIYYKPNNATQNFNLSSGNLNIWPSVDGTGSFFDRTFHTDGTFNAQNFFCEAEIKLPRGRGLRPVFALFNDDEHEIIVMNAYPGAPTAGWASADLSPIDYKMASTENFSGGPSDERRASSYFVSAPDLSAAFHTFGVHFGASAIRWYYDGVQIGTTHTNTYQTVPMYIYIGLWMSTMETSPTVGSGTLSSSNPYTPQGVANAMQVNYVRAWRIL